MAERYVWTKTSHVRTVLVPICKDPFWRPKRSLGYDLT